MSEVSASSLRRAAAVEFVATAFLLIAVVGSGIAAERLSGGNVGLALLANALATSGALFMLILTFGGVSGAHMNPIVTVASVLLHGFPTSRAALYIVMQVSGAIAGTWVAHLMFDLPILQISTHVRTGPGQWIGELVATFGLLVAIARCIPYGLPCTGGVVASYIGAAYWFTSSTSFANPAVTVARTLTGTFSGIRVADMPAFILAQCVACGLAVVFLRWLHEPAGGDVRAAR